MTVVRRCDSLFCVTRRSRRRYVRVEEISEYQQDKSIEEMADVLEVLFAICEARGYSVDELMKVREEKREKRGGFGKKVFWCGNE